MLQNFVQLLLRAKILNIYFFWNLLIFCIHSRTCYLLLSSVTEISLWYRKIDCKLRNRYLSPQKELYKVPQHQIYWKLYSWSNGDGFRSVWAVSLSIFLHFRQKSRCARAWYPPPALIFNSRFLTCSPGTKMDLSPSSEGVRSCRDMENVAEYLPEVIETARDIGEVFKIILNPRISFFLGFCR